MIQVAATTLTFLLLSRLFPGRPVLAVVLAAAAASEASRLWDSKSVASAPGNQNPLSIQRPRCTLTDSSCWDSPPELVISFTDGGLD